MIMWLRNGMEGATEMTEKAKKIWTEYNRMGEKVTANRRAMRTASESERRRLVRENHELMVAMDAISR